MINKIVESARVAVADIRDGATLLVAGFGESGYAGQLVSAIVDQGTKDLTIVSNNAGYHDEGLAKLINLGRVRKLVCTFPNYAGATAFRKRYLAGEIELELVPQGTLVERIRAAGAGLGGFFTPTGAETELAKGKETRVINGRNYVLEYPIFGDVALIKAEKGDRWGNLVYRKAARNFGPIMASAAKCAVAQVYDIVDLGELDPEVIVTPGIYVQRVVRVARDSGVAAKEAA